MLDELLNLDDVEARALGLLPPGPLAYYAGGADGERVLRDNLAAWGRFRLVPRVLVGADDVDVGTRLLGRELRMPVLAAPTAAQALAHPDGEAATVRACRDAGTVMGLSMAGSMRPREVAAAAPGGQHWLQLYVYRDRDWTLELMREAVEHGFEALVVTVDAPRTGRRTRELRNPFAMPEGVAQPAVDDAVARAGTTAERYFDLIDANLTWETLAELIAASPLPLLVKGIHHPEDARLAVECGAAGIVVSNHGGRQLDVAPATADLLGPVVAAVDGRLPVLVDGGVRRGTDVCVALALGADAVLLGRPLLWGLAVGGEAGVRHVLALLEAELRLAFELLGWKTVAAARGATLVAGAG